MSKAERAIGNSLKDLDPTGFPDKPNASEVDLGEINLSVDPAEAEKLQEFADGIGKWVASHLKKLDEFRRQSRAIQLRPENQQSVKGIQKRLDDFLDHQEPAYRQAAWKTLLAHKFQSAQAQTYEETMRFLDRLVEAGYLEEGDEKSPLQAWNKYFRIPKKASFTGAEFREVKSALEELVRRVGSLTVKARTQRAEILQRETTLSPQDLFAGIKGTALLYVPPEISQDRDGKIQVRRDGLLFAECRGDKRIFPKEGIGSFSNPVADAVALGVFVQRYSLDWDFPPTYKNLAESGSTDEQIKKIKLAWYLLKRAKQGLEAQEQADEEKADLGRKATISQESFFLERKEGTALVDLQGSFKPTEGKEIRNFFFLVKRKDSKIQILMIPNHLKELLSRCLDEYPEGEKFQGVPQPLQAILQAGYGQVQTKSLLAHNK